MPVNPFDEAPSGKPAREEELSRRVLKGYDIKLNLNIAPYTNLVIDMNTIVDEDDVEHLKACILFAKDLAAQNADNGQAQTASKNSPANFKNPINSNPSLSFYGWSKDAGTKTFTRVESDKVLDGICPICNAALPAMGMSKKGNVGCTCKSCKTWIGQSK